MDIETTFDLLSSSVRRTIIAILHEAGSAERHQLTKKVSAVESDGVGASEQDRRQIRIALHHNHLPRLAERGLITYGDDTVAATAELETVAQAVPLPDVTTQIAANAR